MPVGSSRCRLFRPEQAGFDTPESHSQISPRKYRRSPGPDSLEGHLPYRLEPGNSTSPQAGNRAVRRGSARSTAGRGIKRFELGIIRKAVKLGMPDVCVSRRKMVILSRAAGAYGRYFFTWSSTLSLPRSPRRMEAAVNLGVASEPHTAETRPTNNLPLLVTSRYRTISSNGRRRNAMKAF